MQEESDGQSQDELQAYCLLRFLGIDQEGIRSIVEACTAPHFVAMWDGKHTNHETIYTWGLGGCIATLLYFEDDIGSDGILTHYPGLHAERNVRKLEELRDRHLHRDYRAQRGVILVEDDLGEVPSLLENGIRNMFPDMVLQKVAYDKDRVGTVRLDVSHGTWRTAQHETNRF